LSFFAQATASFAKILSGHWFLRKTPFFWPKIVIITSTPVVNIRGKHRLSSKRGIKKTDHFWFEKYFDKKVLSSFGMERADSGKLYLVLYVPFAPLPITKTKVLSVLHVFGEKVTFLYFFSLLILSKSKICFLQMPTRTVCFNFQTPVL
jgi:hypothetical protein